MGEMMKAVTIVADRKVELTDVPKPVPGPNQVLLRIDACALCTWEQRVFSRLQPFPLPFTGGHEFVGHIAAIGENLSPEKYPIGTRAVARQIPHCGECPSCRTGRDNKCRAKNDMKGQGGLSDYYLTDVAQLYMVDKSVPVERMLFTEPLACVITRRIRSMSRWARTSSFSAAARWAF